MSARTRYARGLTMIPSARDRRIARQLEADALECFPELVDDDGEGLVDVDDDELVDDDGVGFLTPAELEEYFAGPDWERDNARDMATYAEVAETTAFMRAYLRRAGLAAAECPAGGDHVGDPTLPGACAECRARALDCVDCGQWVAMRTPNQLCADCALAHLEGVALSHLVAS